MPQVDMFKLLYDLRERGTAFCTATIVDKRGSIPQVVGARAVFTAEGRIAGTVGGGRLWCEELGRRELPAVGRVTPLVDGRLHVHAELRGGAFFLGLDRTLRALLLRGHRLGQLGIGRTDDSREVGGQRRERGLEDLLRGTRFAHIDAVVEPSDEAGQRG